MKIPKKKLTYILYIKKTENSYKTFKIAKKSGGERVISAPSKELGDIQREIAKLLLRQQKLFYFENNISPNIAHAYTERKSIITNAKVHKNKSFVLNIDLENFFESFHFGRVKGYLEKNKNYLFQKNISTIIAQLTCYNGSLPQGAPSSPIITNLICNNLDMKILKICKKYKLNYTRYADDLTFSTNNKFFYNDLDNFLSNIEITVRQAGFNINHNKTRIQFRESRQVVTGLVVNKKVNVKREFHKNTRAMANSLYRNGSFKINDVEGTINQLEGRFAFINQLCKDFNVERKKTEKDLKLNFRNLNGKEKEYQKFLFYKNFICNEKPCIVTEGPTDITYLKSALKNLYLDFPNLIEKKNGKFEFKITFLKRSKKMKYFFDIDEDGADTLKNIYNYFSDEKEKKFYPNYIKIFQKMRVKPTNPVIFLLDNEISNDKKPLKKLINHMKISSDELSKFKKANQINVKSNLHVITNQLVNNQSECEIEDLFNLKTLNTVLDGKVFERDKAKYDENKNYGKKAFSSYVWKNYEYIDFQDFKPLLNIINNIVKSYVKKVYSFNINLANIYK